MKLEDKNIFSRNIGLITESEQAILSHAIVGIAGTGADGGLAAERIARLGVAGIKLSDPETFDESNINRQFGATPKTVGFNKSEVVADELLKIRPDLKIEVFKEGINKNNSEKFVKDCNVVLDEIEYTTPVASILLHKAARKSGIDVFAGLNLGFGINIFRFSPSSTPFEQLINFSENSDEKEFRMESLVPNIPSYVDSDIVKKVMERKMYVPTISPTIGILAGFLSYLVLGTIIKRWTIPEAPKFLHFDMFTQDYTILEQ